MAIDTIKSSAVLDGAIATVDIADDAVTGAKIENNPTIAGNLGVAGDLTVDTSSLKVNASNNFIGIGTASPQKKVHILDTTSDGIIIFDANGTTTDHQIVFAHNYQSGGQSGGNYYGIGVDASENKLVFAYDANSQASLSADAKMTLNSNGVLSVPSGVELGLNFAGAASNTLDDYEEGSWTPFYTTANNNLTLNGNASTTSSMYTSQSGSYIKIGRKVIAHVSIATNGVTSHGGSGNLWLGGLPFTSVTTSSTEPRGVNGAMAGRFSSFTPDQLVGNGNATTLQIRAGFESYPTRSNLDTGGSSNRNVIEALIVYSTA